MNIETEYNYELEEQINWVDMVLKDFDLGKTTIALFKWDECALQAILLSLNRLKNLEK